MLRPKPKTEKIDMILTTQLIEDRIRETIRVRTAINFNEYIRLIFLTAGVIIAVWSSIELNNLNRDVVQKSNMDVLPKTIFNETETVNKKKESDEPYLNFDLYMSNQLQLVSNLKLLSLIISFILVILTMNYYRLKVFNLTKKVQGDFRPDPRYVQMIASVILVFINSQSQLNTENLNLIKELYLKLDPTDIH